MLEPGVLLNGVDLDLDADTHIVAPLRLQHVTSLHLEARGVRLGCELVNASNESLRALQRYIDQTQKRRRLMILDAGRQALQTVERHAQRAPVHTL